jgi:hypothetical protein
MTSLMNVSIVQTLSLLRKYFARVSKTLAGHLRARHQQLEKELI